MINLIITTYAGRYNTEIKVNDLKNNLMILNALNPAIDIITIVRPRIEPCHQEILGYYDLDHITLDNIRHKIKIIDCANIGISYGQFFVGVFHNLECDYHIFIEDDYVLFRKDAVEEFLNEYHKHEKDSLLCTGIRPQSWDIIQYIRSVRHYRNYNTMVVNKFVKHKINRGSCKIPDFSLCIFSRYTVDKIIARFSDLDTILDIFSLNFKLAHKSLYQILFGVILHESGIPIHDITNSHVSLFYVTAEKNLERWHTKKNLRLPLFVPIQIIGNPSLMAKIHLIKDYLCDPQAFFRICNELEALIL